VNEATWLPNLVGGTSIWKLAVDLNETKFFDGRLLVPETEGSESLPVTVRWDLTGLVRLDEARKNNPNDVDTAVKSFQACLERVAKVFSTPNSGFDKYKDAFTVPSLEADGGANYFYSPDKKKLFVINWGASPRSMGGKSEYVFGYEDWGKHWGDPTAPGLARGAAGVAVAGASAVVTAKAADAQPPRDEAKKDEKEEEKKKKDDKGRPWWIWPLFGLVLIALLLLALFVLKACEDQKIGASADAAADALASGAAANAEAGREADAAAASSDGGGEAGADASAMSDSGDAGGDAGALGDGGRDGGRDGGLAMDDDDDDFIEGSSGGASGGVGSSGGTVVVKIGPGGGQKTSVHRKHYSDEATKWRVSAGANKVSRTEQRDKRFDVWLTPGQTFEGVKVEWQDKAGKWHVH
jgi:hypothetical protein